MLIWRLRIVHTNHGIARMEKEEKMMMQIVFCWIPLLCLVCPVDYCISTPCTLIKLFLQKI